MYLVDLQPEQRARLVSVDVGRRARLRFMELGFIPGAEVSLLRAAPGGGPMEFEVRGSRSILGRGEAAKIQVELLSS